MAIDVILPALGMSQDTGKIVRWLKAEGEQVVKGQPLVEIETDKATVEIEAPADGVLNILASAGDDVPVGQNIAHIRTVGDVPSASGERKVEQQFTRSTSGGNGSKPDVGIAPASTGSKLSTGTISQSLVGASALASRIAAEHNLDLSQVKAAGRRIQKADVMAYLQHQQIATPTNLPRLLQASPKARRLAREQGKDLASIKGHGPDGAVLAADVLAAEKQIMHTLSVQDDSIVSELPMYVTNGAEALTVSNIWRIMAERTTKSWTSTPHFYLVREVNASRLVIWREQIIKRATMKVTYTDLLVKIVAAALRLHPRVNVSWSGGKVIRMPEVHVGLAVAIEDGLVVPVIHHADTLSPVEIAQKRADLVARAAAGRLRPQDIEGGTFTISNLGMYNVDAFNAIINYPQAAILAVGRIAERVVPVNGQPMVQPMITLTLSCDHRAVDGARGARFLDSIAALLEEPLGLLV